MQAGKYAMRHTRRSETKHGAQLQHSRQLVKRLRNRRCEVQRQSSDLCSKAVQHLQDRNVQQLALCVFCIPVTSGCLDKIRR